MKPIVTHGLDTDICLHCHKGKIRRTGPSGPFQIWCDVCNRQGRKRAQELDQSAHQARLAGVEYWWEQSSVYPQMRGKL